MDPERQREIASKGGRVAHEKGSAHEWTIDEAREAGRKGGFASHRKRDEVPCAESTTPPAELNQDGLDPIVPTTSE